MRHEFVACYGCQMAFGSGRESAKKNAPTPSRFPATVHTVMTQTLKKGNKTLVFPVAFVRPPLGPGSSTLAATKAPPAAPAPAATTLPLDVFLGTSGRDCRTRLVTSEATADNQSGALVRTYRYADCIKELHWTAQQVVDEFSLLPPDARKPAGGASGGPAAAAPGVSDGVAGGFATDVAAAAAAATAERIAADWWLMYCCITVAVTGLFADATRQLRNWGITIAARLDVGGGGVGGTDRDAPNRPPFNMYLKDTSIERYAKDMALLLFTVTRLALLSLRPDAARLADVRDAPVFSDPTRTTAAKTRAVFPAAVTEAENAAADGDGGANVAADGMSPAAAAAERATRIGKRRDFAAPVSALLWNLFHEMYAPRPKAIGGGDKAGPDVCFAMPFVALLFPAPTPLSSSRGGATRTRTAAAYMKGKTGQHMASSMLSAIRVVKTLVFFNVAGVPGGGCGGGGGRKSRGGRTPAVAAGAAAALAMRGACGSVEAAFEEIRVARDPFTATASGYVTMFASRCEQVSRAEEVLFVFVPCDNPAHVAGCPPSAVCGTLLDRGFHLGTLELGRRVDKLQVELWHLFKSLTFGYDPTGSGVFAEGRNLADQPSVHTPGVGFLELPVNQMLVRRWQAHLLASGVLDHPDCPVRPAFKSAAAAGGTEREGAAAAAAVSAAEALLQQQQQHQHPQRTVPEVDPTASPVVVDAAGLASWRKEAERVRLRLAVLFIALGGAPGWRTEVLGATVVPSAARSQRMVFVHQGRLFTVLTYNKTSIASRDGGRPNIRWMDGETSTMTILLLVFFNTLEAFFATADTKESLDQSLLFRDARGAKMSADALSSAFATVLLDGVADHFTSMRAYRQWTAAAAKHVTKVDILAVGTPGGFGDVGSSAATAGLPTMGGGGDVMVDWGRVLELQSGHAPTTASTTHAGDARETVKGVNNSSFSLYWTFSNRWKISLGV